MFNNLEEHWQCVNARCQHWKESATNKCRSSFTPCKNAILKKEVK